MVNRRYNNNNSGNVWYCSLCVAVSTAKKLKNSDEGKTVYETAYFEEGPLCDVQVK